MHYLKQKTINFSRGEKSITLLIDKVYTANRVECQNGTFVGLTEDDACSQTVLTFMYLSKLQRLVCLAPVKKLDAFYIADLIKW